MLKNHFSLNLAKKDHFLRGGRLARRHVARADIGSGDTCLPPRAHRHVSCGEEVGEGRWALWRHALVASAGGSKCHMSSGQLTATREVVHFVKFVEKWSFLTSH
jgi:hypothetical protein